MCVKCKKRVATVFVTRNDNGKTLNEGFCVLCAQQIGINPFDHMLKNLGLPQETVDSMSSEIEDAIAEATDSLQLSEEGDNGGSPAIDFQKFFSGFGLGNPVQPSEEKAAEGERKKKPAENEKRKFFIGKFS